MALYLVLLPLGHLWIIPVAGAWATGTDLLLAALVAVGVVAVFRGGVKPRLDPYHVALLLFLIYGGWILLGAVWAPSPGYAVAKGSATIALALGAACVRWSGLEWGRAVDAWLLGALLAVAVSLLVSVLGPGLPRDHFLYRGGGVTGLPIPRLSGPFPHPNMLGDYLVVSGLLLWARWPMLRRQDGSGGEVGARDGGGVRVSPLDRFAGLLRVRGLAPALAGLIAVALFLSFSTAWMGIGLALILLCREKTWRSLTVRIFGGALLAVTLAGILFPLRGGIEPVVVETNGIRPHIWAASLETYSQAPLLGVGASPFLAEMPEVPEVLESAAEAVAELPQPSALTPASVQWWDAHSLYLSVLAQFGIPGVLLFGGGVFLVVRVIWVSEASRARTSLLIALAVLAVHGLCTSSEDFRHIWALVGVLGLTSSPSRPEGPHA